jgi:NAD(P)-dependent dehydrogenase (short-subunit alcohol dehydrogenase family)
VKLRHPLSGALYRLRDDGLVEVAQGEATGVFHADGRWHAGALREADPHFLRWVGGPGAAVSGARPSTAPARAAAPRPVIAPPRFERARDASNGRTPFMDIGLRGRKCLVTAATRGIGLAIARGLADEGADVALCARGAAGVDAARADLEGRGVRVFAKVVDVADGDTLRGFVADAAAALGGLDVLVCNASAGAGMGERAWQANFEVDVLHTARAVEAARPSLEASDAASVVFIASTAAIEYLGVPQPYNALKAALLTHASDLAQALAPKGIRVNAVSPGPIAFAGGNWEMIEKAMPAIYERALAQQPMGRMGTPEEVARAVVFLASPAASWITGANLVVDGGFTKRVGF